MTIQISGATISGATIAPDIVGEQVYDTPGTYTWVAPAGVYSVNVVAVGGGGSGAMNNLGSSAMGGGGGGVGIYGQGSSGADTIYDSNGGYGGNGGSGGFNGSNQGVKGTGIGGDGGAYGGGGGGSINNRTTAGDGATGAVRIIWGNGRSFPNNAA